MGIFQRGMVLGYAQRRDVFIVRECPFASPRGHENDRFYPRVRLRLGVAPAGRRILLSASVRLRRPAKAKMSVSVRASVCVWGWLQRVCTCFLSSSPSKHKHSFKHYILEYGFTQTHS
jgi:hypothetical protein